MAPIAARLMDEVTAPGWAEIARLPTPTTNPDEATVFPQALARAPTPLPSDERANRAPPLPLAPDGVVAFGDRSARSRGRSRRGIR